MFGHGRTDEPDPDHSPDPGAGFTPDFLILTGSQQVMDGFRWNFMGR